MEFLLKLSPIIPPLIFAHISGIRSLTFVTQRDHSGSRLVTIVLYATMAHPFKRNSKSQINGVPHPFRVLCGRVGGET